MKKKMAGLLCLLTAALSLAACHPAGSEAGAGLSSGESAPLMEFPVSSGEAPALDTGACEMALEEIAAYEPDTAGGSLKLYVAAGKLLNFTETYDESQEQALRDTLEAFLDGMDEEGAARFFKNLPAVEEAAAEIIKGGGEVAARLDEAGNPQEYDSYTPERFDAAKTVIGSFPAKTK